MYYFAQTNIQLLNQLAANDYSKADLILCQKAYQLTMSLFTGHFRADEKTFIGHLVRTASILASVNTPIEVVTAGLLHAAYLQGNFGDESRGISQKKQEKVREIVGEEVESYIAQYTALEWGEKKILMLSNDLPHLSLQERYVVLMRLANDLEEHLDLGVLYCANYEQRLRYIEHIGNILIKMTAELGTAGLANELERVFKEIHSSNILTELRSHHNYSFLLPPKSYQQKPLITLGQQFILIRRSIKSTLRRFLRGSNQS